MKRIKRGKTGTRGKKKKKWEGEEIRWMKKEKEGRNTTHRI